MLRLLSLVLKGVTFGFNAASLASEVVRFDSGKSGTRGRAETESPRTSTVADNSGNQLGPCHSAMTNRQRYISSKIHVRTGCLC